MNTLFIRVLFCTLVFLVPCSAVIDNNAVDIVINAGMACHNIPGLAVAVVKDGNVILSRGYGVTNLVTKAPVNSTTLFGIASLSKAFTTTLLSKVLNDDQSLSKCSINTKICAILGRNKFNNSLRSQYATIEDLMAHRMGIPRNSYLRLDSTLTRSKLIRRIKYLENKGSFRDSFYYNDLMYGLLTHITEKFTGKSWEDSLTENIFTPLHMDSSTFGTRMDFYSPNVATPYVKGRKSGELSEASQEFMRHWAMLGGPGAVGSNADDMSKWMLFHLSGGENQEGVQVMEKKILKETYKPRNALSTGSINKYFRRPNAPVTMSNDGYGLGWKSGYYRGLKLIQHSGTTFGYRNFLSMLPDKKLGVFVTMNGRDPLFRVSLSAYLMDVLLGETPWLNSSTICTFPASRRRSPKGRPLTISQTDIKTKWKANLPLRRYAGTFKNRAYGKVYIRYDRKSRQLKATYGIGRWVLKSRGGDKFRGIWDKHTAPRLYFTFEFLTKRGKVKGLSIPSFGQSFFRRG